MIAGETKTLHAAFSVFDGSGKRPLGLLRAYEKAKGCRLEIDEIVENESYACCLSVNKADYFFLVGVLGKTGAFGLYSLENSLVRELYGEFVEYTKIVECNVPEEKLRAIMNCQIQYFGN